MGFRENVIRDSRTVFLNSAEFAETVTYNPDGGAPVALVVVIDWDQPEQRSSVDGTVEVRGGRMFVPAHEADGETLIAYGRRDTVTIASEEFAVVTVGERPGMLGLRELEISRTEPIEKAAEGYRVIRQR